MMICQFSSWMLTELHYCLGVDPASVFGGPSAQSIHILRGSDTALMAWPDSHSPEALHSKWAMCHSQNFDLRYQFRNFYQHDHG